MIYYLLVFIESGKKIYRLDEPQPNTELLDVASGTGDIAKLFLEKVNNLGHVTCIEPNNEMLKQGKSKLRKFKNIKWENSYAEKIPQENDKFDYYSISYGIRNVADINQTLKEAFRVLKPGGRFMCLEFSKINNETLNFIYKNYSKIIPFFENNCWFKRTLRIFNR